MEALQGFEPRYRLDGCIRWGLVEREIHQAIDAALNEKPQNIQAHRPERAGGDVEMQTRAESARSGSVQRHGSAYGTTITQSNRAHPENREHDRG